MENTNPKTKIVCDQCDHEAPLEDFLVTRPVKDGPAVTETGVNCPNCGAYTHSYYMTPKLNRKRIALGKKRQRAAQAPAGRNRRRLWEKYKKDQAAYQREFSLTQERIRPYYGQSGPGSGAGSPGG